MADTEVPVREGGEETCRTPKSSSVDTTGREAVMGTQTQDSNKLLIGV